MKRVYLLVVGLVLAMGAWVYADPTMLGFILRLERRTLGSFPPAVPLNEGGLLYDSTSKLVKFSDGVNWSTVGGAGIVQVGDIVPIPFVSIGTQQVRSAQINYEGAAYFISSASSFSSIRFKAKALSPSPTISILVYQAPGGGTGIANLKASVLNLPIPALGNYSAPITEGTANLEPGRVYILWGKLAAAGGSVSLRVYGNDAYELFNSDVPSGLAPSTFGTLIATNTAPPTFNPAAITGQTAELAANVALVVRLTTP
jgi:hypothetical protein